MPQHENNIPLSVKAFIKAAIARFQELFLEAISFKVAILVFVLIYLVNIPKGNLAGLGYLKDFIAVFASVGVGAYKFFDKRARTRSYLKSDSNFIKGEEQ